MRLIAVGLAVAAASVVAGANAVVAENGPTVFVGSRAENFYPEIYSVAADRARESHP